ncbi:hydroxyacylglutathione hydrolase [Shewanella mangrovisoli]|uniref:Hydroxyacylglutathione hydrolase n=1 Tax=Shewanella mangrovisoli TaxID=2864211 RepID=A0ABV4VFD7_9GAMM
MLTITAINAFNDNYIWVLRQDSQQAVYVVDPGDANVVLDYLHAQRLSLAGILITHHHRDHTGGIADLTAHVKQTTGHDLAVYGPQSEDIQGINQPIEPTLSDTLTLPFIDAPVRILSVPGHTAGHIAYLVDEALFCGDTLFSAGCGRLFEGTPRQMWQSLSLLAALPDETRVYCAHEYTLSNLKFAQTADTDNEALNVYVEQASTLRAQGKATIPSTIGLERAINPFLRPLSPTIVSSIKNHFCDQDLTKADELTCFTLLRQWKDIF